MCKAVTNREFNKLAALDDATMIEDWAHYDWNVETLHLHQLE